MVIVVFMLVALTGVLAVQGQISSSRPPKLAIDTIRRGSTDTYVQDVAQGLGFATKMISGNAITESDLADVDILLLFYPQEPYFSQTELDLILNFLSRGEALYIISSINTYYNILYEQLGFKLSGVYSPLSYPDIKNITYTHPIMDGVSRIESYSSVVSLDLLTGPAVSLLTAEQHPLFLVSSYGNGRVFVDLTINGIGARGLHDNLRIVRNALIWLKNYSSEFFQVSIDGQIFDINVTTNSIISSFRLIESEKSIAFNVTGLTGTSGECSSLSIPDGLMSGQISEWNVTVDGFAPEMGSDWWHEGSFYVFHILYDHSTHEIKITSPDILPEFPSFLLLPLLMLATLLAAIAYRRKRIRYSKLTSA
jgi:hypothetical protein